MVAALAVDSNASEIAMAKMIDVQPECLALIMNDHLA
jgi:hypothetical protein